MNWRYRKWVKSYQHQVYSLAAYLLNDQAEAEDVAQEVFVKLWRQMERELPSNPKAWLLRVTRNACIDRIRRYKPVQELHEELAHTSTLGPANSTEQVELGHWLHNAIGRLKEPYRSLVVMRDINDHSYQEVAQTLELSLQQVKVYLYRARRQLREQLAEVKP